MGRLSPRTQARMKLAEDAYKSGDADEAVRHMNDAYKAAPKSEREAIKAATRAVIQRRK